MLSFLVLNPTEHVSNRKQKEEEEEEEGAPLGPAEKQKEEEDDLIIRIDPSPSPIWTVADLHQEEEEPRKMIYPFLIRFSFFLLHMY